LTEADDFSGVVFLLNKMSKPILFSYYRSSASFRVRIALAYKGIDYEYRAVNLVKGGTGEQLEEDYRKVNSMCQVPSLVVNGVTLTQSLPIIEYLEETHPEKPLLPRDPILRAQARRVAEIVNSGIQPLQNLATLKKVTEFTGDPAKQSAWAQQFMNRGFEGLEQVLSQTAGKFCVGDDVTIADVTLVPQYLNATRFNVDMTPFPLITRIASDCLQLEAFQAAHPSRQPDCPPETK
jgi:maleylacetoacetate isomerase